MPWLLIFWRRTWRVRYLGILLRKIDLRCNAQMQHIYFNPSELNRTRRNVFFLHPTQAYSSTQTFSSPCRGPSRPTRPYGRFLSTVITHAVLLVHTDVFSPLLQFIQANPSTQKSPHRLTSPHCTPQRAHFCHLTDIWTFRVYSPFPPSRNLLLSTRTSGGYSSSQSTQSSLNIYKDIWRLLISTLFYNYQRLLFSNRTYGDCTSSQRNLLIIKTLISSLLMMFWKWAK